MPLYAQILISNAPQAYTYIVPQGMAVAAGDYVRVSLGARRAAGVVWAISETAPQIDPAKLKPVLEKLDIPPLTENMREFVDWVARYNLTNSGRVLKQVLAAPQIFETPPPKKEKAYRLKNKIPAELKLTTARQRVLDFLHEKKTAISAKQIIAQAKTSRAVLSGLEKVGAIEAVEILPAADETENMEQAPPQNYILKAKKELSPEQKNVAKDLCAAVDAQSFSVHLLDGVTGSGKTEVYFEAVAAAIAGNKPVLILLPEISLTAQFLTRFYERFGVQPQLWHSGLSPARRREIWRAMAAGKIKILAGARSALFLPYNLEKELGLIIIDEEHDPGFKQEEGVIYNARDMAVVRARIAACPIILSSATPSLETYINAEQKRYCAHRLRARHHDAALPQMGLVDMRDAPPTRGEWLSPLIHKEIAARLAAGEQSLLFLNRRGYAPLILCRGCGYRYQCENCDSWLVAHQYKDAPADDFSNLKLQCHHCGAARPLPPACESCGAGDKFAACGPGVERIGEEITTHYPQARISILSSDHSGREGQARLAASIKTIAENKTDIIIGTQIVAKGHHFPHLGFVGVVDADLGLANGDLRAAERSFQILTQVAGRSGREKTIGRALLQSYQPQHPVLQALVGGGRDEFFAREAAARKAAKMPPFGRLASVIISAPTPAAGWDYCRALAVKIPNDKNIRVLGPAPAPIARLRNRYRFRFLIKGEDRLQDFIKNWLAQYRPPANIKLVVDIDPYNFF